MISKYVVASKPEPFTVKTTGGEPAIALSGEMEVICGAGLLMTNWTELDVNEPMRTPTEADPAEVISDAEIVAVTC